MVRIIQDYQRTLVLTARLIHCQPQLNVIFQQPSAHSIQRRYQENTFKQFSYLNRVNRGKLLRKPGNIKEANKQAKIYVGGSLSVLDPTHLLFYAHWLCMNYRKMQFCLGLVVWALVTTYIGCHLYFARSTPKNRNKNVQQQISPGFISISLY